MAREHIEFIQSADVEQKSWAVAGLWEEHLTRILSYDTETGGSTELVEWRHNEERDCGYFNCNVEIFVLNGELRIGKFRLGHYTYGFIPEGVCLEPWTVQEKTTALWMSDSRPSFVNSQEDAPGAKRQAYIPCMSSESIPWSSTITPGFPTGAMRKNLRQGLPEGSSVWLLGCLPQFATNFVEYHPLYEEHFVLQGSITTDAGKLTPGCYFWRPGLNPHGPTYTETGYFAFVRGGNPHLLYYA
ncbi:MAG: DUF4437 domain-containing protein [Symploca sp. SIO2G7]|nr:DUF4437 domain-containing protein [Symploca sp. SIO2G7]